MQLSLDSPDSLLANFSSINIHAVLFLLSGPSGSGKTYWCQKLVGSATARGVQASGLVSPPVFEHGVKAGIDLLDITSGEKRQLAVSRPASTPAGTSSPEISTQKWLFDPAVIAWGNQILSGLPRENPLLILDELGPLEFLQDNGLTTALDLVGRKQYKLACVVVRPELLPNAQERWPWGRLIRIEKRAIREDPR